MEYEIESWLEVLGLPPNAPLNALAMELLPEPDGVFVDPLGKDLGQVRVLRASPLTPVPAICLDTDRPDTARRETARDERVGAPGARASD